MNRTVIAAFASVATLALAPLAVAQQSDVRVFSREDAEKVLADPAPESDASCPVRMPNGSCARTSTERGFRLASPQRSTGSMTGTEDSRANVTATSSRNTGARAPRSTTGTSRNNIAAARAPTEVPLQFALGSFDLSPQSKANLKELADALNATANQSKRIRITGHTDKSGNADVNQKLSQQRADAAADYMASVGVDRSRIEAVGVGFSDPLPEMSAYAPRNRRVEVVRVN